MYKKIRYGLYSTATSDPVFVTNSICQEWELKRNGISEDEIRKLLKGNDAEGKSEIIKKLISDGKLVPVYGGELNL